MGSVGNGELGVLEYASVIRHMAEMIQVDLRQALILLAQCIECSDTDRTRMLWALGVIAGCGQNSGQVALAKKLFHDALPALGSFSDSRAIAFPILGIQAYLRRNDNDRQVRSLVKALGNRLQNRFRQFASKDWQWHEAVLTYDNARLPEALMACGRVTNDDDMVKTGIDVLEWLRDIQLDPSGGWFAPVGNQGWFPKSGSKAQYDQQPLEAAAMIGASIEAYECTQREEWIQLASTCFNWYLGKNDQQINLCDHASTASSICHQRLAMARSRAGLRQCSRSRSTDGVWSCHQR